MTAVSVFVLSDCAHIITDGAAIDDKRVYLASMQKVVPLPHLNVVVTATGHVDVLRDLMFWCSNFLTLEAIQANLPAVFKDHLPGLMSTAHPEGVPDGEMGHVNIVIAGVFDGRGFAWLISNVEQEFLRPFELTNIPYAWGQPPMSPKAQEFAVAKMASSPRAAASAILNSQRSGAEGYMVGSYGHLATVDKRGISLSCVCRWPDVPGQPIGGSELEPDVPLHP